jgi:hypothetical protein
MAKKDMPTHSILSPFNNFILSNLKSAISREMAFFFEEEINLLQAREHHWLLRNHKQGN